MINTQLRIGDRVKFCIGQSFINQRNAGACFACKIELIEPLSNNLINTLNNQIIENNLHLLRQHQLQQHQESKQTYRGIISSLKDSFGKIEREDQFKETFFHFTEFKGESLQTLRIGMNVEFEIQDKYGKEIATNIKSLPDGTVCFDELSRNIFVGRITQAPIRLNGTGASLSSIGRLIYDANTISSELVELTFTDRDRIPGASDYSFLEGDFVQFRIATDKRKRINSVMYQSDKRATQLTLIEEYSLVDNSINTNEHRERGVLSKIYSASELLKNKNSDKQKYGVIKCLEHDELIYFSFNELINYVKFKTDSTNYKINQVNLEIGDSLEFSVVQCQKDQIFKNGLKAIRLLKLAKNTVQFEIISTEVYSGIVEKEASSSGDSKNDGLIRYDLGKTSGQILFNYQQQNQSTEESGVSKVTFNIGDKVEFNILTCIRSNKQYAINMKLIEQRKQLGFITMLKDNYGFIELNLLADLTSSKGSKLPRDIFFHFRFLKLI